MKKELVIIYDTPSVTHAREMETHNLPLFLNFFDRVRVLYWSKEDVPEVFEVEKGKFVFYPYLKSYDSGYVTGLKFMAWIARTLWKICQKCPQDTRLVFLTVIPIWSGLPTLIVGKLKRKKVVLRLEAQKMDYLKAEDETLGVPGVITALKLIILKAVYFLTMPFYDCVIGISKDVTEEARRYGARNPRLIPVPVKIKTFIRARSYDRREESIIFSVGQIKKRKGLGEVVEALQALRKEDGLSPKLIVAGEVTNPKDEAFFQELKKKGEGLQVEFKGWVSHEKLPDLYHQADVFVHASYAEALGMVIMEAMAAGLPVIATRTSGAKDLIEDGKTGFLVPVKDARALKEKIKFLLKNPQLRESMARAGRDRIESLMDTIEQNNRELWTKI